MPDSGVEQWWRMAGPEPDRDYCPVCVCCHQFCDEGAVVFRDSRPHLSLALYGLCSTCEAEIVQSTDPEVLRTALQGWTGES